MTRRGFIARCEAQTVSQKHILLPTFAHAALTLLYFLFLRSLAAHYSIAKFDVWPPAQAEMERANRAEVSASRRVVIIIIIVLGLYISLYDSKNIFKWQWQSLFCALILWLSPSCEVHDIGICQQITSMISAEYS